MQWKISICHVKLQAKKDSWETDSWLALNRDQSPSKQFPEWLQEKSDTFNNPSSPGRPRACHWVDIRKRSWKLSLVPLENNKEHSDSMIHLSAGVARLTSELLLRWHLWTKALTNSLLTFLYQRVSLTIGWSAPKSYSTIPLIAEPYASAVPKVLHFWTKKDTYCS